MTRIRRQEFAVARAEGEMSAKEARVLCENVRGVRVDGNHRHRPYFLAHCKASRPFPDTPEGKARAEAEQQRLNEVMVRYAKVRKVPVIRREVMDHGVARWIAGGLLRQNFPLTPSGFDQARTKAEEFRRELLGSPSRAADDAINTLFGHQAS
jgi:hypothetical protein